MGLSLTRNGSHKEVKEHQWFLNALKRKNSLYCRIDVWGFVSVMLALLFLLMPATVDHPRVSADLAVARHATWMPGALKEDALRIVVTRDGNVFFRNAHVMSDDLADEIRKGVKNGAEKKVYLLVDARAKYGDAKMALDQVRLAGIENVSFLTESPNR